MKHKGLLITCIVLLSVIVVLLIGGLVFALAGGALSFSFGSVPRVAERVIYDGSFEGVTDIVIDSDCGDITVQECADDQFYVTAFGEYERDITVKFSDGKLNIIYPQKRRFFNWSSVKNNICLEIPKDFAGSLRIESDYGNVQVCDLPGASADIDCDYGDITLGEIRGAVIDSDCGSVGIEKAETAKIDVDYGNIRIGTVSVRCELQNDCGDIAVDEMRITESSTVSGDLGNIVVGNAPGVRVQASTDLGKLNILQNDEKSSVTLNITNDCGNITVGK